MLNIRDIKFTNLLLNLVLIIRDQQGDFRGAITRTADKTRDFSGIAEKPFISPCQPANSSCPPESGSAFTFLKMQSKISSEDNKKY